MNVAQLMASPFFGGPERQVLGLARHLPPGFRTTFLSFAERGLARPLLDRARQEGFAAVELKENWPHLFRASREVADHLQAHRADVVCTSGYKSDLVGWLAARRVGIPSVAIAHGWTGATWKVRLNERLDRWVMRRVSCVVSVSEAQADRVRRAGVAPARMVTIPNAVDPGALARRSDEGRRALEGFFARPPGLIVCAAGRLSPEKGFDVLVDAAARLASRFPEVGFLLFGDGPLRAALAEQIHRQGLDGRLVLGGFRTDLERLLPCVDVQVLSSHTEGLPVIVLEAMAAGVPVVATAVGGVPEVVLDGSTGLLVAPGSSAALAERLGTLLADPARRQRLGEAGRHRIVAEYSCVTQARRYQQLFERLVAERPGRTHPRTDSSSRPGKASVSS